MENTRLELEKLTGSEDYKQFKANEGKKVVRNGVFSKSLADIVLSSSEGEEESEQKESPITKKPKAYLIKRLN